jgi:uncharacterized protein YndB with AHSA1/START domain
MPEESARFLELRRVIHAPRRDVFAAFVTPTALLAWWAPQGWYTPHVEMDLRVGGRFRFGMRSYDNPSLMFLHGEYLVIDPPQELRFTYVWEPGGAGERWREMALIGVVTTVTLRLRDLGDRTELYIRHDGFPTEPGMEQHRLGWSSNWECLEDFLTRGVVKPPPGDEGTA